MATPPQGRKMAPERPFPILIETGKSYSKTGLFPAVFRRFSSGFPKVYRWFSSGFPAVFRQFSSGFPAVFRQFPGGLAGKFPGSFTRRFCRRFSGSFSTAVLPTVFRRFDSGFPAVFSASSTAVCRWFSGNNASPGSTPVIAGLEQAGFKSWRGGKGGRTFSTEVCHGGDSPRKLSIWPRSDGGFGATCFTAGCKGLELFNRIRHKAGIRPQGPPTASSTARNGAVPTPTGGPMPCESGRTPRPPPKSG